MEMTRDSAVIRRKSKRCRKSAGRLLRRKAASRQKRSCRSVKVQFLFHVISLPFGQAVKPVPWHLKQGVELLVIQVDLGKSQTACCYAQRPQCWSSVEDSQCQGASGTACMYLNSIRKTTGTAQTSKEQVLQLQQMCKHLRSDLLESGE